MKKLKRKRRQLPKLCAALGNARGESLVEAMVSILVFAIFMLMVLTAIVTSQRISAASAGAADDRQKKVNDAVLTDDNYSDANLSIQTSDTARTIDITIPVEIVQQDGLTVFRPRPQGGTGP